MFTYLPSKLHLQSATNSLHNSTKERRCSESDFTDILSKSRARTERKAKPIYSQELGNLIRERPNQSVEVPEGFCQSVRTFDTNRDNRLDFEEFYKMCKEHRWLIKSWCVKYCNLLVPPRKALPKPFRPMAARFSAADTDLIDHVGK